MTCKNTSVILGLVITEVCKFDNLPGESKVSDFDAVVVTDETVAGGEVAVDEALTLEVLHTPTNLTTHVHQHARLLEQLVPVFTEEV